MLNSFDGDQHASHFSQCTTKMQQLDAFQFKMQSAYQSAFRRFPIFLLVIGLKFFSPALFYQTFSCDIDFIFIRKCVETNPFFFLFDLSFFCCNVLHPDTSHCTMRHYKLLYHACSVSTWKTVMHTKLNRFTAKPYTRDREKMHDIL